MKVGIVRECLMNKDDQDKIFTYLLTSARGCIEEPPLYGSLRLLETYNMLLDTLQDEGVDEIYFKLRDEIDTIKYDCMENETKFIEGLDRILELLVNYVINKK